MNRYFNPKSISLLLEDCGFKMIEVTTHRKSDAEMVRKDILSGALDISDQPFLQCVLIEEWDNVGDAFPKFLAVNRLSSHMWIVAGKE